MLPVVAGRHLAAAGLDRPVPVCACGIGALFSMDEYFQGSDVKHPRSSGLRTHFSLSVAAASLSCLAAHASGWQGTAPADEPKKGVVISGHDGREATVVLTAYTERASPLYRPFLDHASLRAFSGTAPALLVTDLDGVSAPGRVTDVKFDDPDRIVDPRVTAIVVPQGSPRVLQAPYWPVPGYGVVWLKADNGGHGYSMPRPGVMVLNLNYEFARTQLRLVKERARKVPDSDLPAEVNRAIDAAERALEQAASKAGEERARHEALAKALVAGDDLELEIARRQIRSVRTGRAVVTVVAGGAPLADANVTFRQVSHDFLFGVVESFGFTNQPQDEAGYRRVFGALRERGFNHYTVSLFWDQVEQKPGEYRFADWERRLGVKQAVESGMSLKAHALLQESVPRYLKGSDALGFAEASRRYFEQALHRFEKENGMGDAVVIWQAANEPSTNHYAGLGEVQKADLLKRTVDLLHRRAPKSKVIVNDVYADWGQRWEGKPGPGGHRVVSPIEMFEALGRRGVDYDLAGLEWYPGLRVNFFNVLQLQGPLQGFASTSAELDRYARLDKPLHITEFAVPSTFKDDWKSGWWRQRWNPQVQADYAERFYTIAFSKKHVREITYWGISDNEPWVIEGGLMTKAYQPKPILDRLGALIGSWTSNGSLRTDGTGRAAIAGFAGHYDVTVEKNGRALTRRIHIDEQGDTLTTFDLSP